MKNDDFFYGKRFFVHYCIKCDEYSISKHTGCICCVCDREMKICIVEVSSRINNGKCQTCTHEFNCNIEQQGDSVIICKKYENGSSISNTKLFLNKSKQIKEDDIYPDWLEDIIDPLLIKGLDVVEIKKILNNIPGLKSEYIENSVKDRFDIFNM